MFLAFLISTQTDHFVKAACSLCIVANFDATEKLVIFQIVGIFWSHFFAQNDSKAALE